MSTTPIQWTDYVWNPTRGCSRVSEGCRKCYAERLAARNLPGSRSPTTGEAFAVLTDSGPHWTGKVELIESKLLEPLRWKKPRRVFVNSMSDLYHESLPDEAIDRVCAVMALTPHITYQVLTKRAGRLPEYFAREYRRAAVATQASRLHTQVSPFKLPSESIFDGRRVALGLPWEIHAWPLPNVWLGVSVENQPTADARIPKLLQTPAAVRFVSYEPALGPVDFRPYLAPQGWVGDRPFLGSCICHGDGLMGMQCSQHCSKLDWGIVGGESGTQARPCELEWIESTVDQFEAAGVPLFVKQVGSKPVQCAAECTDGYLTTRYPITDPKGGNWKEWPEKLRVREFPR